jgi:LacI family transcriptional regulator
MAKSGGGRATIRDVAARAGVSVTAVSRILNGSYPPAPETRERVMQAVRELNYVANPHARALTNHASGTIGVVVSGIDEGVLDAMVQSIMTHAAAADSLCLIGTTRAESEREFALLRQMQGQNVDALIVVAGVVETDEYRQQMSEFAASAAESGTRLVLCARPSFAPDARAAIVEYDNEGGSYAATSHLLSRGHRRILSLGGPERHSTTVRRLEGYRKALTTYGMELDPALERYQAWSRDTGYAAMRDILAAGTPDFTGILAYNDQVALGAIQALRGAGLRVPEDVSIVGYDDARFSAAMGLTTVNIPAAELGRIAVELALDPDRADRHVELGTHVIMRESVGYVGAGSAAPGDRSDR